MTAEVAKQAVAYDEARCDVIMTADFSKGYLAGSYAGQGGADWSEVEDR